ncbi:MAG: DNA repair protein RecO [Alphaproteobacteria bacterium]|nr:DNA repair protein RecO [Alphaproteobacteria bacterium]
MESWESPALVLHTRPHGEGAAVVSLMTEEHGRHLGYVHGVSRQQAVLQPGTFVQAQWQARVSDQLGTYKLEMMQPLSPIIFNDAYRISALLSACALCEQSLPERENHPNIFNGLAQLLYFLSDVIPAKAGISENEARDPRFREDDKQMWGISYVFWELSFLKELGFALDWKRCAVTNQTNELEYMSPKSGRAVSKIAAEPYKDKLLPLPLFLQNPKGDGAGDMEDVLTGLRLTRHFLDKWVFAQTRQETPTPRLAFEEKIEKLVAQNKAA